jgi:hypothetical protein
MTNTNVVPNDTPATGTPQSYSDAAAQALKALDAVAALIPTSPLKQGAPIQYIRRRQAVNPELIDRAVDTVEATPSLQSLLDPAQTRDSVAFNDAFRPVLSRINAMGQDLRLEIDLRHAKAGEDALAVYATAKRLSTRPSGAELASHVAAMKPVARPPKKRTRKKATTEPPAATTAPSAPTVPTTHSVTAEESPTKQS